MVKKQARTLTPVEYRRLIDAIPEQHRLMIQVAFESGLRCVKLIALRPRHLDLDHGRLTVTETIVEVPLRAAPNGQRMYVKPYPKDSEPRALGLYPELLDQLARAHRMGSARTICCSRPGPAPRSPATPSAPAWTPAVRASGVDYNVRIHYLRHAHASWLLAGGSDLCSVMDRMGHSLIQTTQKYLHALPDADQRNLDAFRSIAASAEHSGIQEETEPDA